MVICIGFVWDVCVFVCWASIRAEKRELKCSLRNTKAFFIFVFAIELWIVCWCVCVFRAIVMVLLFVRSTNWFLNKIFASLSINCGYWDYDASGSAAATAAVAIDPKKEISVGQWTHNNQQHTSQFIRLFIHPFKLRIHNTLYAC